MEKVTFSQVHYRFIIIVWLKQIRSSRCTKWSHSTAPLRLFKLNSKPHALAAKPWISISPRYMAEEYYYYTNLPAASVYLLWVTAKSCRVMLTVQHMHYTLILLNETKTNRAPLSEERALTASVQETIHFSPVVSGWNLRIQLEKKYHSHSYEAAHEILDQREAGRPPTHSV